MIAPGKDPFQQARLRRMIELYCILLTQLVLYTHWNVIALAGHSGMILVV